jgi:hypothetical protein
MVCVQSLDTKKGKCRQSSHVGDVLRSCQFSLNVLNKLICKNVEISRFNVGDGDFSCLVTKTFFALKK